jgi:hypothetical protein
MEFSHSWNLIVRLKSAMARLPDRFDLWVRKARQTADLSRQRDLILGALVALPELLFLNIGTQEKPLIAKMPIAPEECALVFTNGERLEEFIAEYPETLRDTAGGLPVIASPTAAALKWCVESRAGLVINPDAETTVMTPAGEVAVFVEEWLRRGGRRSSGFWIPNMTTEEEDFWQEHGM